MQLIFYHSNHLFEYFEKYSLGKHNDFMIYSICANEDNIINQSLRTLFKENILNKQVIP